MNPQIACRWGCKVTLITFFRFFSTVCFQMNPQIACPGRCIFTLVAFFWHNYIVRLILMNFHIQMGLIHCLCVLFLAPIASSNWGILEFWSQINQRISFSKGPTFTFSECHKFRAANVPKKGETDVWAASTLIIHSVDPEWGWCTLLFYSPRIGDCTYFPNLL